jgi:hypothetical protein
MKASAYFLAIMLAWLFALPVALVLLCAGHQTAAVPVIIVGAAALLASLFAASDPRGFHAVLKRAGLV